MKKGKSYVEKLKDPRWQKKRLEIFKRDKFTCKLCKDNETELQVHHKEYINGNDPWDYPNNLLITFCSHCHQEIELLKKSGEIDYSLLKVYKSNDWEGGGRIMFVSYNHSCRMRIYDEDGNHIVGFSLEGIVLYKMISILSKSR